MTERLHAAGHPDLRFSHGLTQGVTTQAVSQQLRELEPNRRIEITTIEGPLRPATTYWFEPVDDRTRFSSHVDIPLRGPVRLLEPLLRRLASRRNARFTENVKAILER